MLSIQKTSFFIYFGLLCFYPSFSYSSDLTCKHIYSIQKLFLKQHILHKKLTSQLHKKSLKQFIKNLDKEKIYFLKSDIKNIVKKNRDLFSDLKDDNCTGLYYIYDIYKKRLLNRTKHAQKFLNNKNFTLNKKLKYVLKDEDKTYSSTPREANKKMQIYIQYQVANLFLFEKNLKEAIKKTSYTLSKVKKEVLSWNPNLSILDMRICKNKSQDRIPICKPSYWFAYYLQAYSHSLDPHSSYFTDKDSEEFFIAMNLSLQGIGASLSSRFGYIIIEKLLEGGSAIQSKQIKLKDRIQAVGQTSSKLVKTFGENIGDVVSLIRGPKGTSVYLQISREQKNKPDKVFIVKLIRKKIHLKDAEATISYHKKIVNKKIFKIGLLKVPSFYGLSSRSVTKDTKKLLKDARKHGVHALVLDLSNNSGGSLEESVNLSGLFFSKGNVVKQSYVNKTHSQILKDLDGKTYYKGPLVVLINRLSASASEIVSGTLQVYKRAVIVGGDHSFGKGSIQTVKALFPKLGAIKTTIGLYFIPNGESTQKQGITPDIIFPNIFSKSKIAEKYQDHALSAQKIPGFKSSAKNLFFNKNYWNPVTKDNLKLLKQKSHLRVSKNKKFQEVKKEVQKYIKKQKNKTISLAEVLKNKEAKNKKFLLEKSKQEDKNAYFKRSDVQEALNIAADFISINQLQAAKLKNK